MIKPILYALPEISLLLGLVHLFLLHLFKTEKAKIYSSVSKFWLLASVFFSIIFYDKTFTQVLSANSYTLLFYLLTGFFAYIVLGLSSYWFNAKNRFGCYFYTLILLALLCLKGMLETTNLDVLFGLYVFFTIINHNLSKINYDKKNERVPTLFFFLSLVTVLLFGAGVFYLSWFEKEPLSYSVLQKLLAKNSHSLLCYISAVFVVTPFLSSLGVVPFHIASEDKTARSILPVSHYFTIVSPIALLGVFIKLNVMVLTPLREEFSPVYVLFALISVVFGALGTNARINLYRILAYVKIYYWGIILLLLSYFSMEISFIAVLIGIISILAFNGMYLVFYSIKSRGEYLTTNASLSGLAESKPYTAAILTISLFSLIGIPPLAGFLAEMHIITELINQKNYISLGVILFFWLVLSKSGLELIKTTYFERRLKIYDTENKLLLFYIFLNIFCLSVIVFNPFNIIEKMKDMFYVIYL